MTTPSAPSPVAPPVDRAARAVLLWHPDRDESQVLPDVEQAAQFLRVPTIAVEAAIDAGDLLQGWFADWHVPGPS